MAVLRRCDFITGYQHALDVSFRRLVGRPHPSPTLGVSLLRYFCTPHHLHLKYAMGIAAPRSCQPLR